MLFPGPPSELLLAFDPLSMSRDGEGEHERAGERGREAPGISAHGALGPGARYLRLGECHHTRDHYS